MRYQQQFSIGCSGQPWYNGSTAGLPKSGHSTSRLPGQNTTMFIKKRNQRKYFLQLLLLYYIVLNMKNISVCFSF
jgi:hypothetical protein